MSVINTRNGCQPEEVSWGVYHSDAYSLDPVLALERVDENLSHQLVDGQATPFEALVDT